MTTESPSLELNWSRQDVEQRFGFSGGKYTDTHSLLTFLLASVLWLCAYGPLFLLPPEGLPDWTEMFMQRGPTPYFTLFLFFWSLAILWIKSRKLRFQRKTLNKKLFDMGPDFTISPGSASDFLKRLRSKVDDPRHFLLLNRISLVLSNFQNTGARSDISEMLRSQAEIDEGQMESSYALIRGFVWSIPILGFIGTVLGLSKAIGSFGEMLGADNSMENIKIGLQTVTGGLSTAFDTTLLALVSALIVQLLMTVLKKKEEMFLDDCNEFCQEHIVSRVRMGHLTQETNR